PPPEPAVCEMPAQTSTVSTTPAPGHTTPANQMSFPHGQDHSGGDHGSSHATTSGHGHSGAEQLAHATHPMHVAHQGIDIVEGVLHSGHAAHGAQAAELGVGSGLLKAGGVALAPIVIIGGAAEIAHGVDQIQHGNAADGTYSVLQGGTGVVGGGATLLAVGGTGAVATTAATVAPLAAAGGAGLAIGHYGDGAAKEHGILHDDQGRAESVSDRLGRHAWETDQAVTEATGSGALGTAVGLTRMAVELPAAGVVAVGSAAYGGGAALYHWIAD
ncbi:MAG TPA: hypothetical protein V6D23_27145, partial [Candidatus Obscuribacterales bacterium]